MDATEATWLRELSPSEDGRPVPVPYCSRELLTRTTAGTGPGAVAWALQVGHGAAERIFEEIPLFGASDELRALLYAACESATLTALGMLSGPDHQPPPLTEEAKSAIGYYAEHDIPLDQILRGIRFGHAEMSSALLAACDSLTTGDGRTALLRVVSAQLFDHMDRYAREGADHYKAAHDAWAESSDAVTRRIVEAVLAGTDTNAAALPYELEQTHRAVIVTRAGNTAAGLQQVAYDVLRRAGAASPLIVPVTSSKVWAWGGFRSRPAPAGPLRGYAQPGVRVSVGAEQHGIDGFRESHRQALGVHGLQQASSHPLATLLFDDVEMAVLLASDLPAARRFVARILGPLAEASRRNLEILSTVKAYLDLCGSPSAVADRMNLARNTVSARIQRASQVLRREIGVDCADLHGALVLVDLLGERVLTDAPG
ncbi:PucR family transcriptional regulator [Amycolatopsis jejuensis]|uniref:PucR family transcriptional regulator n=1 Tax=Amycolatopsis jejuensis TaxID=330084 RepID=UPI0005267201|nr:helix-turn-helix domain-containing protein [Amycolatopsis jejuensis]